jgi:predicted O-linked N-acetylglucosamine transferase (SPINDLY family)
VQEQWKMDKSLLENLKRAVSLNPRYAEGHFAIANIYLKQNNLNAALLSFQQAINAKNDFEAAYLNAAQILRSQAKYDEAITIYQKALATLPNSIMTHLNLGVALLEKEHFSEAFLSFEQALKLDQNCTEALINIGQVLRDRGKISEAAQMGSLMPKNLRSRMFLATTYSLMGKAAEAIECWREAITIDPKHILAHQFILNHAHFLPEYSREKSFSDHAAFGERVETPWRDKWPRSVKPIDSEKRLRVGFVSGDLGGHPVGHFTEGILRELRKRNGVDIVIYPTKALEGAVTDRIRAAAHTWAPVHTLSDDSFEQKIRNDNIDILVDLSGHTNFNRLPVFARKPAPVQVAWLGYWDTTGLQAMDYILCDRYSTHDEEAVFFSEKLWYLPHTRFCFTLPGEPIAVASLPARNNGYVTFGCFNNLLKINRCVIPVWSRILKHIPNARLLLKSAPFADSNICKEVMRKFTEENASPEQLKFQSASSPREYYLAYNHVDIALDPFPFPGGATSVQGIWMGVPMVTLQGDRMLSRQGESILHNIGLRDWIAKNPEEYVELAVRKANDLSALAELRSGLRARLESSPLCDTKSFAHNLEDAFKKMWEKYAR